MSLKRCMAIIILENRAIISLFSRIINGYSYLIGALGTQDALYGHLKVGASFEGSAINTILSLLDVLPEEAFYWASYSGAKMDLVIIRGNSRLGFEFKYTVAPGLTRSVSVAQQDLRLLQIYIVHAGTQTYSLASTVTALALCDVEKYIRPE